MKSKSTVIWLLIAALLSAAIWAQKKYWRAGLVAVAPLLPGLLTTDITGIQVTPAEAREISVARTNGQWVLQKPLFYPAQKTAVDSLAEALVKLVPVTRLTAADLREHKNPDVEFGFDTPRDSVVIAGGGQRRQLNIGKLTAPGDQVYVRVVGTDGIFVTDAGWLQWLPRAASDWRDTELVNASATYDWIVITNAGKLMEFRRDPTNQLWRMTSPLKARADGRRLATALQQLQGGQISQFITDDPRDLSSYGLQPANLDVWLGRGTNLVSGVQAGNNLPDNASQIYVRRAGWNTVAAAGKDAFSGWRGAVNDYRDPHLLNLTAPVGEIEFRGTNNTINYTLQFRGTNWVVAGEKYPGDAGSVQALLKILGDLRVSEFVKDLASAADLQSFGLADPAHQIILRAAPGDTNAPLAQLSFGTVETNRVFAKRADEESVYAITPSDYNNLFLFDAGWFYRDRRVWNFSETNVAQVTLHQSGKTRVLIRTGENKWSLGSQGILDNPPAVEETIHRLGQLTAAGWVGCDFSAEDGVKNYGLNPDNLSITVELKTGEKLTLEFGGELPALHSAFAAVTYGNERWAFIFPAVLYQFITTYLTIPPNAP